MLAKLKTYIVNRKNKKRVVKYLKHSKDLEVQNILKYLQHNDLTYFNYNWFKNFQVKFNIEYNSDRRPYIQVDGKKMYFKKSWGEQQIKNYYTFLCAEQYSESPHCYFDKKIDQMQLHKVVDGGAAEGHFSLKLIERCDELYLFECDEEWIEALELTFKPWKYKIHIIKKFLSDVDDSSKGTLDKLILNRKDIDLIKLDIEGEEVNCLKGAKKIINLNPQIVILACAYHYQTEEAELKDFAYTNRLSIVNRPGYIYFFHDNNQFKPYLRRGVLKLEHNQTNIDTEVKPLISICIPSYNNFISLKRLLDSIINQTYTNVEIIITDDSSTESLKSLISNYNKLNIQYVKNEECLGATKNCNKAMSLANGDCIKIMHHDDWFSSKYSLEKLVDLLYGQDDISIAFCGTYQVSSVKTYARAITHEQVKKITNDCRRLYLGNYIGAPSAVIFKKRLIYLDENLFWLVDMDFYITLLKDNPQFSYTVEPLISIGINDEQLTNKCINDTRLIIGEYLYMFNKYNLKAHGLAYKWYLLTLLKKYNATSSDYKLTNINKPEQMILQFGIYFRQFIFSLKNKFWRKRYV